MLARTRITAALVALAACAAASAQERPGTGQDALLSGPGFDAALLAELNAVRAAHGLAPVASDPRLAMAARRHSSDMAEARQMQHQIAGRPDFRARVRASGARVRAAGENILRSDISRFGGNCAGAEAAVPAQRLTRALAEDSVRRWMGSPQHRASMLNPRFRRAGASFAVVAAPDACGQIYVTQVFGG